MTAWTDSSEQLQDLALQALDHALGSLEGGEPLIAFALVANDNGIRLTRFIAESLEEGVEQGRTRLAGMSPAEAQIAAFAYDGYLRLDGVRSDAIFVEAQARGMTVSASIAQRYKPSEGPPDLIGDPADAGDVAPLWAAMSGSSRAEAAPRRSRLFRRR